MRELLQMFSVSVLELLWKSETCSVITDSSQLCRGIVLNTEMDPAVESVKPIMEGVCIVSWAHYSSCRQFFHGYLWARVNSEILNLKCTLPW